MSDLKPMTRIMRMLAAMLIVPSIALAQDSDPLEKKCWYGISLAMSGKGDQATTVFASLLSSDPADPRAHTNLGNLSLLNGEFDNALSFYRQALAADSTDAGVFLNMAIAHMLAGEEEAARKAAGLSIERAGGLGQAAALVGIELEAEETRKASNKVYLDIEEIKNLLRSALGVPQADASPAADSLGSGTQSLEIGSEERIKKRARVWRSGAPRASGDTRAAGLLYWKSTKTSQPPRESP